MIKSLYTIPTYEDSLKIPTFSKEVYEAMIIDKTIKRVLEILEDRKDDKICDTDTVIEGLQDQIKEEFEGGHE